MVACKAILRWLLALGVGGTACGCAGMVPPRLFGPRTAAAYRRPVPELAPPLRIAEPPTPAQPPPLAKLLAPLPEPPELPVATPPLAARGPVLPDPGPHAAGDLRSLYRLAAERLANTDAYTVRLRRRERVDGQERPEEVIVCKVRRNPPSVHFRWLSDEGQDREVVYVRGRDGNLVHWRTAAGDMPLVPLAGKHIKLTPNSTLVKTAVRLPLTDAGIQRLIERFGAAVDGAEHGDPAAGSLTYLGLLKRSESEQPLKAVLHVVPAGAEPNLPEGGEHLWFFDAELHLPVLVITHDRRGKEVAYCCYDQFSFLDQLPDKDFDPERLWRP